MAEQNYATFHGYLDLEALKGTIDFSLRLVSGPNGERDFYIRPADKDGETGDFTVVGNVVLPIPDGHGAGSRRPGDRCDKCGGEGRIYSGHQNDPHPRDEGECRACAGTGWIEPAQPASRASADFDNIRF